MSSSGRAIDVVTVFYRASVSFDASGNLDQEVQLIGGVSNNENIRNGDGRTGDLPAHGEMLSAMISGQAGDTSLPVLCFSDGRGRRITGRPNQLFWRNERNNMQRN